MSGLAMTGMLLRRIKTLIPRPDLQKSPCSYGDR